jgi:hypothetical protein
VEPQPAAAQAPVQGVPALAEALRRAPAPALELVNAQLQLMQQQLQLLQARATPAAGPSSNSAPGTSQGGTT